MESDILIMNDASNGFAFVHELESVVDIIQWHGMGDEIVECKFAVHILLDDGGQFAATFNAAESGAAPNPACNELEWACVDFGACRCYADDDGFAPAFVTAFKR